MFTRQSAVCLCVCAACMISCSRQEGSGVKAKVEKPATVAVAKVVPEDLSRELVLTAEFRPFQEIDVHAKIAGYVKSILVDVGDRVRQGQLLAVLEVPEMANDLQRAVAATRRSSAELARAKDELARSESAHSVAHLSYTRLAAVSKSRPELIAQQEIDEALGRDRVAEAQVSAARSALAAAEQQLAASQANEERTRTLLAYSRITAPFAGVITKRYADLGAMIQAGTASQTQAMPVVRLSEDDRLRLVLDVPESVVPRIRMGAPVEVRVSSLNRSFRGRIARNSGQVQLSTRTMTMEVDVPNPERILVPGMYAEAVLILERRQDSLAVPLPAISGSPDHPTVFTVSSDGIIESRRVRLGIETSDRVEVLSGLNKGDLVVVGSRARLKPGQRVQPKLVQLAELEAAR